MGTKAGRGVFNCLISGSLITGDYIKKEGKHNGLGSRLMAIIVEGKRSRLYILPTEEIELVAKKLNQTGIPKAIYLPA